MGVKELRVSYETWSSHWSELRSVSVVWGFRVNISVRILDEAEVSVCKGVFALMGPRYLDMLASH